MNHRLILSCFLALLLAGCASLPHAGRECLQMGRNASFCPLPPQALPQLSAQHVVTVRHGNQSDTFVSQLQIDNDTLRLAGTSMFGTHMFTLGWDGQKIHVEPARHEMRPWRVLAMLELALADPDRLQASLKGVELEVTQSGDDQTRRLIREGEEIARVVRQGRPLVDAHMVITLPGAGMTLKLQPLERPQ